MKDVRPGAQPRKETDEARLRGLLSPDALTVDLVSAFAGDRPLSEEESRVLIDVEERRKDLFFTDLLYAVTHQFFAPAVARPLWCDILRHKYMLSKTLGRNVRITVATLDYLSNFTKDILSSTVINEDYIARIADLSMRDGLTGLFNHTSCHEIIELELKTYLRYGTAVSLILADIDDFKKVNDQHGHQEGDRVLVELAGIIRTSSRESDIGCRYGGEEFVVILPSTDTSEASEVAERIREGATAILVGDLPFTVSFGVASCDPHTITAHALVEKADQGLYQAKQGGKNKVVAVP
jgi:diguanylate cyclase (GGDEF)-like protein